MSLATISLVLCLGTFTDRSIGSQLRPVQNTIIRDWETNLGENFVKYRRVPLQIVKLVFVLDHQSASKNSSIDSY